MKEKLKKLNERMQSKYSDKQLILFSKISVISSLILLCILGLIGWFTILIGLSADFIIVPLMALALILGMFLKEIFMPKKENE